MSETLQTPASPPETAGEATPAGEGPGTWRVTWHGAATVARLDLRQRVRSTRWIVVLVLWGVVLLGLAALIHHAVFSDALSGLDDGRRSDRAGAQMFSWMVLLVLALGSLVAPALSATSVNGDRAAGVLATLQATLLTPAEIALGKLLAAWLTALALLAVALPAIGWAVLSGGTSALRLLVTLVMLAVVLLVQCAIGLGWSALTARTASSAVLTYLSVAFLGLGLPVLFALMIAVVSTTESRQVRVYEPIVPQVPAADGTPAMRCVERQELVGITHTEQIWWLLVPNPFVVVADAAPVPAGAGSDPGDVLSGARQGVRELRLGERTVLDSCPGTTDASQEAEDRRHDQQLAALGPVWPYGLAANLAIGAGFTVLAVRRLRAPARTLPRGTRVA